MISKIVNGDTSVYMYIKISLLNKILKKYGLWVILSLLNL